MELLRPQIHLRIEVLMSRTTAGAGPLTGFTLIELMIGIGLSVVLCVTAFAALRMAQQAVSKVNHLSMNNRMLQHGIAAALDDLDFWTSLDDESVGDMPLRKRLTNLEGAAFAQLDFDSKEYQLTPGSRLNTYFDQSDLKSWFHGDGSTPYATTTGNYPLLSKLNHPKTIASPSTDSWREWHHRWIATVVNWGYYAYLDYSPSNFLHSLTWDEPAVKVPEFYQASEVFMHLYSSANSSGDWNPRGFYDLTYGTLYGVTRQTEWPDIGRHHHTWWGSELDTVNSTYQVKDFCRRGGWDLKVLPQHPEHWAGIEVVTKHFIVEGRSFHTGTVTLADPVTANKMKLFITNTGTTLRGARRQRNLDRYLAP
jgi:type II secretory pathway pseudopilin PulG